MSEAAHLEMSGLDETIRRQHPLQSELGLRGDMNEEGTRLVVELAKQAITAVRTVSPDWTDVFLRFNADDAQCGWKGSYANSTGVHLFDVLHLRNETELIISLGLSLRDALKRDGKGFVVCLVRANSDFQYQIDFEWHDATRWNITKLNGGSGLPEGMELLSSLK